MIPDMCSVRCSALAYNEHRADVAPAQVRVGGVLYVDNPAGHQYPKPCHYQVLHLHCRQTRLCTNEEKQSIKMSAQTFPIKKNTQTRKVKSSSYVLNRFF